MIVEPPIFDAAAVASLLSPLDISVEAAPRPWQGNDVVGLLVWQAVSAEDMDRLPELRAIVTGSIGFDHIDLKAAMRRGIWVCNVPDYCVDEVADSTIALLLALLRGVAFLDRSVRDGAWDDHAAGQLQRISDVKLGIIGFGRIGRAVAQRAKALGMETCAADPLVPPAAMTSTGVRPATLNELLESSTAITLHVPFTPGKEPVIGAAQIRLMPTGSYLVNTARGQLVDTNAVLAALDAGRLAGAAIDVLPTEPPTPAKPVPKHRRLIVTPHAAWLSPSSEREVSARATLALKAVLEGSEPSGIVIRGRSTRPLPSVGSLL